MLRFFSIFFCFFMMQFTFADDVKTVDINHLSADVAHSTLTQLQDDELADTYGQALFSLEYLAPGQSGNPTNSSDKIGFYTLSMEAELQLNSNIKNLQVGCGGVNGANGCDLDISNFSLGCVVNSAGVCISLPKVNALQPDGQSKNPTTGVLTVAQEGGTVSSAVGDISQKDLKNFVITNPFYQFAIKNPDSASTREIVGLRIGGAQVKGPMSFGSLNSFSGYLTGTANLDMQEMGKGRNPLDVAVTCGASTAPCPGTLGGTGQNTFGYDFDRTLGLDNDQGCVWILVNICEQFKNLTVSFDGAKKTAPVAVNGNRVTQAMVSNLQLGSVVDGIVDSLSFVQSNGMPTLLLNLIKGLIQGQVKDKIKGQLASGLGTSVANLNSYVMPYNLNNVHAIEVDSKVFGITLSKQALQYPGYDAAVSRGWAMYVPDGFTLNISQPTTRLVQNIVGGSGADGNIALLGQPYRNCYGSLKFC